MGSGYVKMTSAVKNVATTTTELFASNDSAKYRLIQNDDETEDIWLKIGAAAVAHQGIFLAPKSSYVMCRAFDNLDTRAINAIHAGTGTKVVLVTEGV